MKHLSILVPNGQNNLSSVVGPLKIFSRANAYFQEQGKEAIFAIDLVGKDTAVDFYDGLFTVNIQKPIHEVGYTDLIIIPSLNHQYELALERNEELVIWLQNHYKNGAAIGSICTGAFLLASTGLLNGKSCSTHWSAAAEFRKLFPKVNLMTDQIITDEDGIYTNGGAYSFLRLMVYLVEKYYDRETALFCSKIFQIDVSRNLQSEFSVFNGFKNHGDDLIMEAQQFLEENYQEKISFVSLSNNFNVGRRTFDRRFKKATGHTPLEYLQRIKIEAAKRYFENTRKQVNEVMYEVGYNDVKAFRELFSKVTGLSPIEYRTKYGKT